MPSKRQDDSSVFQLYDMGDSWQHEVVVEEVLPPEPDARYPMCVAGERACPPEDVGGIWGYADFLEAIQQPDHPEHEEMLTWGRMLSATATIVAKERRAIGNASWR